MKNRQEQLINSAYDQAAEYYGEQGDAREHSAWRGRYMFVAKVFITIVMGLGIGMVVGLAGVL